MKTWICARDLVPDELLYFDVVLGHKVDRVFLLPDASRSRPTLDRVGAFKYECSRLTCEVAGRESEDLLKFCRGERASVVMDSEDMGKTMETASYTRHRACIYVNQLYVSAFCFRLRNNTITRSAGFPSFFRCSTLLTADTLHGTTLSRYIASYHFEATTRD